MSLHCPGFLHERTLGDAPAAERPAPPRVSFAGAGGPVRVVSAGPGAEVAEGGQVGDWVLMAVFDGDEGRTAVFDEIGHRDGRTVFVGEEGTRLQFTKTLEPTQELGRTWYRGHQKHEVLPGQPDVLRDELLAGGRDPDPVEVQECFPPVRRAFWEGVERPHTFVGTFESADVWPVYYRDVPMVSRAPVGIVAPETGAAMEAENLWEGLVGGWLPVVRIVYPFGPEDCWEVTTVATPEGAGPFLQPVWYRFARLKAGSLQEVKYLLSHIPYPEKAGASAAGFYRALAMAQRYWEAQLDGCMRVAVPDEWVEDFCRHALVLERVTRWGDHPKYGVVDRAYAGAEHDGFQDALTATVTCAVEWGLLPAARNYLDYYFRTFVREDGSIRYRGPEMGKYGVMLSCLSQYSDYADDYSLLHEHDQKITAVADLLVRRWEEARQCGPDEPAFGMIRGHHEADINFLTPNVNEFDYDRPYLSNSAEAWRGLRDLAASWQRAGQLASDPELSRRGESLARTAAEVFVDARRGVERSWADKNGIVGLPIIAGSSMFYWEAPYRGRPESYDENRVWSELLHSGVLPKGAVARIVRIAAERGGSTLGIFTNRLNVVGFLVAEAVQGLLQHDLVPEALLVFYAHAFHAHSRGTWTAIECVDMDRSRAAQQPYCVPAQMTVPTIAKWLLVFEDPLDRSLTLGHGAPRRWLEHGKEFGADNAPTRWGAVSYRVTSRLAEGTVEARVSLPERPGAKVRLRLRLPHGYHAAAVTAGEGTAGRLGLEQDLVTFPPEARGEVAFTVRCGPTAEASGRG